MLTTCGNAGVPAEFLRCICVEGNPTCVWAVRVCNYVWQHGEVPGPWHSALVAAVSHPTTQHDPAHLYRRTPFSLYPWAMMATTSPTSPIGWHFARVRVIAGFVLDANGIAAVRCI